MIDWFSALVGVGLGLIFAATARKVWPSAPFKVPVVLAVWVTVAVVVGAGTFWITFAKVGWSGAIGGTAPDWLTAGATVFLGIVTAALAIVGGWQIYSIKHNQKTWTSLQACDRYDLEEPIVSARDLLSETTQSSQDDPLSAERQREVVRAVRRLLNFFDAIAIGIEQDLYRDDLVEKHLKDVTRFALHDMRACTMRVEGVSECMDDVDVHYKSLGVLLRRWGITKR